MVDEGYNSHAIIRGTLNMGAALPTNAIITYWVNLIDNVIESYKASPTTATAARIEINRLGVMYGRVIDGKSEYADKPVIAPLSVDEMLDLDGVGKRKIWWE